MRVIALLALALAACGGPDQSGFSSGPTGQVVTLPVDESSSSGSGSTSSSSSGAGSADDSAGSGSSGGAMMLDAGSMPDFGTHQPVGCKGKIDFLFAIERTSWMWPFEEKMLASFDGFVATLQNELAEFDSHIMVINPDDRWPGDVCESAYCPVYDHCGPNAENYVCDVGWGHWCETWLGAGVLYNAGKYATNYECEPAGGRRYIMSKEEPDLAAQFKCIASVGTMGGNSRIMEALHTALTPEMLGEEGCNEGFMRSDALLVIVIIAALNDELSPLSAKKYYERIVAAKGDAGSIVTVSILDPPVGQPPDPACIYDQQNVVNRLHPFTEMFQHHVLANVCDASYAPVFVDAAHLIAEVCDQFIPQ